MWTLWTLCVMVAQHVHLQTERWIKNGPFQEPCSPPEDRPITHSWWRCNMLRSDRSSTSCRPRLAPAESWLLPTLGRLWTEWLCSLCRRGNWRCSHRLTSRLCHALSLRSRLLLCLPHNGASIKNYEGVCGSMGEVRCQENQICLLCGSSKPSSFTTTVRVVERWHDCSIHKYKQNNISQHRCVNLLHDQYHNYHIKEHFSHHHLINESSASVWVSLLCE